MLSAPTATRRFMVGLVLVSHSARLAEGLREMVAQVAGDDVPVATAGGTDDGRLGTSAPLIAEAIRSSLANSAYDVLVLVDLGSAGTWLFQNIILIGVCTFYAVVMLCRTVFVKES